MSTTKQIRRSARWASPGASQVVSSLGNSLLALAAARSMNGENFGRFILSYGGVLLVSQIFRVAIGESGLLSASGTDHRFNVAQNILSSGIFIAPLLGLTGALALWKISPDTRLAIATGIAIFAVSLAEVGRYALLARGEVRLAVRLDLTWVVLELGALLVGGSTVLTSPSLLLGCWALSAMVSVFPILISERLLSPNKVFQRFRENRHGWRLASSDALVTLSSYSVLASLALVSGVTAVGEVRASLLPFQWMPLLVSSTWLTVLSRKPSHDILRKLLRALLGIGWLLVGVTVLAIVFMPTPFGRWILNENWQPVKQLVLLSGFVFIAQAGAEISVLRLKAMSATVLVLRVRLMSSGVTVFGSMSLWFVGTREVALFVMVLSQLTTASTANWFLHRRVIAPEIEAL